MGEDRNPACVLCAEPLPPAALLCSRCGGYQDRWKNYLLFASQITAFLSAFVAATVFTCSKAPEIRRSLFWTDAPKILAFKSNGYLVVANQGDGALFLSNLELEMDLAPFGKKLVDQRLDVLVQPREVSKLPLDSSSSEPRKYVGNPDAAVWEVAKQRAYADDDCFRPIVTALVDPSHLVRASAHASKGQKAPQFPATATLFFYTPARDTRGEVDIPAVGALLVRDDPSCTRNR